MRHALSSLLLCLLLASCGGGGGDDGDTPGGGGTDPRTVGTRAVPGGDVAVLRTHGNGFRIVLTIADVSTVEALNGSDYDTAPALALSADAGGWAGSAPAGTSLLVRVTQTDGAVLETAPGDFVLP